MRLQKAPAFVKTSRCSVCSHRFVFLDRPHNCRKCGETVCWKCSRNRMNIPEYAIYDRVRVCDPCFTNETEKPRREVVQIVQEMGYSYVQIKAAIDGLIKSKVPISSAAVVDYLLTASAVHPDTAASSSSRGSSASNRQTTRSKSVGAASPSSTSSSSTANAANATTSGSGVASNGSTLRKSTNPFRLSRSSTVSSPSPATNNSSKGSRLSVSDAKVDREGAR